MGNRPDTVREVSRPRRRRGTITRMLSLLLRLAASALALWITTLIIPGIKVSAESTGGTIGTLLLVAIIFGVINAVLKPIVKVLGCGLYVLTLGLIALVVNGALFLLASWICGLLDIPFHVDSFWPAAILGALVVSLVSWGLGLILDKARPSDR
jgi:putative membrane protein